MEESPVSTTVYFQAAINFNHFTRHHHAITLFLPKPKIASHGRLLPQLTFSSTPPPLRLQVGTRFHFHSVVTALFYYIISVSLRFWWCMLGMLAPASCFLIHTVHGVHALPKPRVLENTLQIVEVQHQELSGLFQHLRGALLLFQYCCQYQGPFPS